MNVGGVPATDLRYGFIVVLVPMAAISAAELWYLRQGGWFDQGPPTHRGERGGRREALWDGLAVLSTL